MSARSSIKNALVAALNAELSAENVGEKYHTDIDNNTLGDTLFMDSIEAFPGITVGLGPERPEYQPGGFRWNFLTLYIRIYVKSEDESEEQLELIISDLKTFIDNFENLAYTVTDPKGNVTNKTVTQITLKSITTDEGLAKPLGVGELNVELRYAEHSTRY